MPDAAAKPSGSLRNRASLAGRSSCRILSCLLLVGLALPPATLAASALTLCSHSADVHLSVSRLSLSLPRVATSSTRLGSPSACARRPAPRSSSSLGSSPRSIALLDSPTSSRTCASACACTRRASAAAIRISCLRFVDQHRLSSGVEPLVERAALRAARAPRRILLDQPLERNSARATLSLAASLSLTSAGASTPRAWCRRP
jgi:hypothetical protein